MSGNTLELVAKFKDNASQGLRRLMNETERSASAQSRAWAQSSRQRQQSISAYQRLGIRSEQQIRREMQLTQAAYNRLARSGTLSQRELARAAEANRQNLRRLNNELRQGAAAAGSWRGKLAGGITTVAAAGLAAYTVLKPSMDNQKQLEANISQVAWQAFGEDSSKSADWIATAGKGQIRDLVARLVAENGGNADAALNLINSQMANGMSFEQVREGARGSYRAMIASSQAPGEYDPESIAKLMKVLHDFGFRGEELGAAFEHAMKSGMQGNFEIADMVSELPALLPVAKNTGMDGLGGFDYLLSMLQSASNKAGSNSEAANNVRNLLEKTLSADTVRRLSRLNNPGGPGGGINWQESVLQGRANGENAVQVLSRLANNMLERDSRYLELKAKAEAGDSDAASQMNIMRGFVLSRILPDVQAKAGLLAASDMEQISEYMQGLAGLNNNAGGLVDRKISVMSRDDLFQQDRNRSLAQMGRKESLDSLNSAETRLTDIEARYPKSTLAAKAAGAGVAGAGAVSLLKSGGSGWAGRVLSAAGRGAMAGTVGSFNWAKGVLGASTRFNLGAMLLTHSPSLNEGEAEILDRMRRVEQKRVLSKNIDRGPLSSPELKQTAEQMQQSAISQQQSSEVYAQAVSDNQQAAAQFLEASRLIGTAAGQMMAAARQPITVSVDGSGVAAAVRHQAARDNRRN